MNEQQFAEPSEGDLQKCQALQNMPGEAAQAAVQTQTSEQNEKLEKLHQALLENNKKAQELAENAKTVPHPPQR